MPLLTDIAKYVTVYVGIPLYTFGFLGNLFNIYFLFPTRHNPCTFLALISSIVDCCVLNVGLLMRILAVGFSTDPTLTNTGWCKIRTYSLRITTLVSIYAMCLMSIDRFFVSCRTVRWRQCSRLSIARWGLFIVCFLLLGEGLPYFILTYIARSGSSFVCTPMLNLTFSRYASFFDIPVLYGILPLSILIIMGLLIYRNLNKRSHLRNAQRHLTLMILLRILLALVSLVPYTSYFVYSAIVTLTVQNKSAERVVAEGFAVSLVSVLLYISYSSSFFVSCFSSKIYRKRFVDFILCRRGRVKVRVQPFPLTTRKICLPEQPAIHLNNK